MISIYITIQNLFLNFSNFIFNFHIFKKDNSEYQAINMSDLHSITEPNRMKKTIDVIEPNTTRVLEMRRIK